MHIFIYHVCVNEATNNSEVRHFLLYYETYLNQIVNATKESETKCTYIYLTCVS